MNHLINRDNIPLYKLVFIGLFLIMSLIFIFSNISYAGDSEKRIDGKLITIHDRGESKVIVSRGVTIGDAINDAGIEISEKDSVEPTIDQKMIASEYQVNIYRARPVIVIDGAIRRKIITPYQTADQIAKDAGVVLFDEDRVDLELSDGLVDGAGLTLFVKRSIAFNFDLYGKNSVIRTQAVTVGEMLQEKNIKMSDIDHLSLTIDTKITEGLSLRLWREGKQTITVEEVVKFESDKIEDGDQPVSYSVVKIVGENGTRNATYEVAIINGQESSRQEIASIITKQPKKQVEVVGVKGKYTTPEENMDITWNFLIKNGFTKIQAAGIMGNLMQEHRFNTSDVPGGLGMVQWIKERRTKLISMYPESYTNVYSQLEYIMFELNSNRNNALIAVRNSSTIDDAVAAFQNKFEGCGVCKESTRRQYAYEFFDKYKGR